MTMFVVILGNILFPQTDIYRPTWNSPPNSVMEAAPISYLKNSFKIGLW